MDIEIQLSLEGEKYRGQHTAVIDECDSDLAAWRWNAVKGRNTFYAIHGAKREGVWKPIQMHRLIAERMFGRDAIQGIEIDHLDGNGLNNRRGNLRLATRLQNSQNMGLAKLNTSGYKGVASHQGTRKYRAFIRIEKRQKHLGYFDSPEEAARAYDKAARAEYGEFARTNF